MPHVAVADLKARLGFIAAAVYGQPSRALWMVGVTGTNGKTSCSHWIAQALARCGRRAAVVGTLGNGFVGALAAVGEHDAGRVRAARAARAVACATAPTAVAMEVSSHGLDQGRVNGVAFDVALFTNLTRDHLDYHGTMAAYGAAKARLFALARAARGRDQRRRRVRPHADRRARAPRRRSYVRRGWRRRRRDCASRRPQRAWRSRVRTP